ncbi:MAG: ATP synthase subunit I [Pseudomonadales bacterium]|nr:ATP synthase subunit I [Pseudomonadales bacterium]
MSSIKAPPVYKITRVQMLVTIALSGMAAVLGATVAAYSMLFGGLISAVPNAYFAHRVFRYRGARATTSIVKAFYAGEAIKLALISAGFALVFMYVKPLHTLAFFGGFVLVHLSGLLMLTRLKDSI